MLIHIGINTPTMKHRRNQEQLPVIDLFYSLRRPSALIALHPACATSSASQNSLSGGNHGVAVLDKSLRLQTRNAFRGIPAHPFDRNLVDVVIDKSNSGLRKTSWTGAHQAIAGSFAEKVTPAAGVPQPARLYAPAVAGVINSHHGIVREALS